MAGKRTSEEGRLRSAPSTRRVVGYLRVSTALQAEQGMGLDVQRDRVTEYAAEHGLELLDVVKEAASGAVREGEDFSWQHRSALLDLMARAERGEYDTLVVARFDRLSRDYATLIVLERRFQRYGVEIVSVAEEHNGDGPVGEFIRGQLALAAQLERAMIRERLSAGKAKAKQNGRHVNGSAPFGYRHGRGGLEVDEHTAEIVRRIFRDAKDGWSFGRIAKALDRDGIPTARGARGWSREALRLILANPAYAGEGHGVRSAHPPIVSRRMFNEVQRALEVRRRTTP